MSHIFHISQMNSFKIEYVVNQFYIINFSPFCLILMLDICVSLKSALRIFTCSKTPIIHENEKNRVTQFHGRFE